MAGKLLRAAVLAAIRFYQRHLSPHKGFCCAYRVHTGRASCSSLGHRAVRLHGVIGGLVLIKRRTHLCGVAHRRHGGGRVQATRHAQQGFCDAGIDLPCDIDASSVCDALDCCDACDCDWPDRKRDKAQEANIYLPAGGRSSRRSGSR